MFHHQYKIVLQERAFNRYLQTRVLAQSKQLIDLKVEFREGFVYVVGKIDAGKDQRFLSIQIMGFKIIATIHRIIDNQIIFKVKKFSIFNPGSKHIDFLRIFTKMTKIVQKKFSDEFNSQDHPFLFQEDLKEIICDCRYFFSQVPSMMGKIQLRICQVQNNRFIFFIHSNLLLRSLLEWITPGYVSVEEIDRNTDVFKLLWERASSIQ